MTEQNPADQSLLAAFQAGTSPTPELFRELVLRVEDHRLLAKVFLFEGTPFVFKDRPMKYMVFREQVADRFEIGSQDVCIVGSARLGFSPTAKKYGRSFSETSDVDVVVISEFLFDKGTRELFRALKKGTRKTAAGRGVADLESTDGAVAPAAEARDSLSEAINNYVFQNLNPTLFPGESAFQADFFEALTSTSGLFLALEPQVFVSKIRGRIFRNWRAAEEYYANTLRQLGRELRKTPESQPEQANAA